MGNMLESDSSNNSDDIETNNSAKKLNKERTAGDGMESVDNINSTHKSCDGKIQLPSSSSSDKVNLLNLSRDSNQQQLLGSSNNNKDVQVIKLEADILVPSSSTTTISLGSATKSPRQLPSRDLLIPVKPTRLDNNIGGASGKLDKASIKQKKPKFVAYEPYTAATRPIVDYQTHTRKSSDTSSIVSQSSMVSFNNNDATSPTTNQKPNLSSPSFNLSNTSQYSHHPHPSNTLTKERLKMAEKEINDLQSENARLKKLFVDSMSGSIPAFGARTGQSSSSNSNSNNQNENNECVDNLNDELEVSRSKFLSSCVLVEQLTKDNHDLRGSIYEAAEIIKDLKNTASLTQGQYEQINEWLRKTNSSSSYSSLPDNHNFCGEDYLETTTHSS